jgi:hypothetical protein
VKTDHAPRNTEAQKWPSLQRRIPGARLYEYEQVPRGRVVYRITDATFLVYGSERFIHNDRQKETVLETFHLPRDRTVFKSDEHYGDVPGMAG